MPPREVAERAGRRGCATPTGIASVDVAGPGFLNITPRRRRAGRARRARSSRAGAAYGRIGRRWPARASTSSSSRPTRPGRCTSATPAGRRSATRSAASSSGRRRGDPRVLLQRPRRADGPVRRLAHGGARTAGRCPRTATTASTSTSSPQQIVAERPGVLEPARRRAARRRSARPATRCSSPQQQAGAATPSARTSTSGSPSATLHESGAVERGLARLREQGHVFEQDGAVWLRTTDFGDDKDRVLIKADGELDLLRRRHRLLPRQAGARLRPVHLPARRRPPRLRQPAAGGGRLRRRRPGRQHRGADRPAGQHRHGRRAGPAVQAGRQHRHARGPRRRGRRRRRPVLARAATRSTRRSTLDLDLLAARTQRQPGLLRAVRARPDRLGAAQRRRPRASTRRPTTFDPALLDHEREGDLLGAARRVPAGRRHAPPSCASRTGSRATSRTSPATYHRFYDACRVLPTGDEELDRRCTARGCGCARRPGRCSPTAWTCSASAHRSGCERMRAAPRRARCTADQLHAARCPPRPPRRRRCAGRLDPRGVAARRAARDDDGVLTVAGVDVRDLAAEHGTPLFVLDEADFRGRAAATFARRRSAAPTSTTRARRSCTPTVARWVAEEGLGLDVVHRRRARRRAARRLPGRADRAARQQQVDRPSSSRRAGRRRRPDRRRLVRGDRPARRRSPTSAGVVQPTCWCGSPSASRRTPTSSSPPRTRTRSSASRWPAARRPRRSRRVLALPIAASWSACTRTSARRSSTPPASRSPRTGSSGCWPQVRDEHGVELAELDLGGGLGIAYVAGDDPLDAGRDRRRGCAAIVARECARARAGRAAARGRAGPRDRRAAATSRSTRSAPSSTSSSTAGHRRTLRQRRRRHERQHPHRALRRRLHRARWRRATRTPRRCWPGSWQALRERRHRGPDAWLPADLAPGDLLAVAATGAYCRSMASNYNHRAAPAGGRGAATGEHAVLLRRETDRRPAAPRRRLTWTPRGRSARVAPRAVTEPDRTSRARGEPVMSAQPLRVALLGCGVVGSEVARLLRPRPTTWPPASARRSSSSASACATLDSSDRGPFDPRAAHRRPRRRSSPGRTSTSSSRSWAASSRPARCSCGACAAARASSPPTRRCSPRTAPSCTTPPTSRRRPLLRGRRRRRDPAAPPAARVAGRRQRAAGARHRQRHHQLHPHADGRDRRRLRRRAGRGAARSATPRPTRPPTSRATTPRPRPRSSPASPSTPGSRSTTSTARASPTVTAADVAAARAMGCVVKLLAICERVRRRARRRRARAPGDGPRTHPLAGVREAFNAVFVEAEAAGQLMFYGRGAGGAPTASAVLGDLVAVGAQPASPAAAARGSRRTPTCRCCPIGERRTRYYVAPRRRRPAGRAGRGRRRRSPTHGVSASRRCGRTGTATTPTLVVVTHRRRDAALAATVDEPARPRRRPCRSPASCGSRGNDRE